MTRFLKNLSLVVLAFSLLVIASCGRGPEQKSSFEQPVPETNPQHIDVSSPNSPQKISYYTCPMHRFYHAEHPGKCPYCGMELVPVYAEAPESSSGSKPNGEDERKPQGVSVSLSHEKMQKISLKVVPVRSGRLKRSFNLSGRVAYDPDLLIAQKEFLFLAQKLSSSELFKAASQRLRLLGMSSEETQQLLKTRKPDESLVLSREASFIWIYAAVDPQSAEWISPQSQVSVLFPAGLGRRSAQIKNLAPTVSPETRTLMLRVQLRVSDLEEATVQFLKPESLVTLLVEAEKTAPLLIPQSALLEGGNESFVWVQVGEGRFERRSVQVGVRGTDDVSIVSGLAAGEQVVLDGNFLIDSESKLTR